MRKKNSAFCYLYDSIVAQIAAGRFPYGASLPSASQLCGIYQVGLRTVRDVMPVLQRDGYIRTQERRRPVVVYRPAAPLSGTNFVRTLLERRSSISAAFEAMAVLMPPLLRFCAEQCTDEELHAYATASRRVRKAFHADVIESWRLSSSILNSILSKSGNPLFRDLYASLELFTQFSASGEQVHPFQRAKEIEAAQPFHWVLAPLLQRDHPEDERRLQLMYRIIGSYADEYLARLSAEYPDAPVPLAGAYHWDATRGRGFLYGEVAHDLTAKLSAGLWEDGALFARRRRTGRTVRRVALHGPPGPQPAGRPRDGPGLQRPGDSGHPFPNRPEPVLLLRSGAEAGRHGLPPGLSSHGSPFAHRRGAGF